MSEFGSIFTIRVLGLKLVVVAGAEANQQILVEESDKFSWGEGLYKNFLPFLGRGLLTTDDEKHDRARELMEPAFRRSQLHRYIDTMKEETLRAVNELEDGQELELYLWMRNLALTIASRTLLGIEPRSDLSRRLTDAFEHGLSFYNAPIISYPLLHLVPNRLNSAREKILKITQKKLTEETRDGDSADNVLEMLMQTEIDGQQLSEKEIKDQILTLLFAGHDTTAATVAWTVKLLGEHRLAYQRTVDHLEERLGGDLPTNDQVMDGLPYLRSVIDEVLRLYPVAWIGPRKTTEDVRLGGYDLPKDTHLVYSSLLTHRRSEYYEDPSSFDPERFLDGKKRDLPNGAYVPFGRGARTCIGMNFGLYEIKTILSILLQKFHVSLLPGQSFEVRTMPTLSPNNGVKVKLSERNTSLTVSNFNASNTGASTDENGENNSGNCPVH